MISLATLGIVCYVAYRALRWMMRAGQHYPQREQPLTPNDLKVLEESAARLIADLRLAADECVAKVGRVLVDAEKRAASLQAASLPTMCRRESPEEPDQTDVYSLIAAQAEEDAAEGTGPGESCAEIARTVGITTGEVELIQSLRKLGGDRTS